MIMSDNPGVSLFQGNEELEIETNTQRLEEQEALEDERRRQAEVRIFLQFHSLDTNVLSKQCLFFHCAGYPLF